MAVKEEGYNSEEISAIEYKNKYTVQNLQPLKTCIEYHANK